jgi:hypothetical protein
MADVAAAASGSYAPALAEVIGYELIPDKPRIRGGILVTFRDGRGALVTIRLLEKRRDAFAKGRRRLSMMTSYGTAS